MISANRLASVIHGLRVLLRLDVDYVEHFERTYDGFVRSFLPALILAPLHFAHIALAYGKQDMLPHVGVYAITEVIAYVMTWTLFPLVMIYVARLLHREERYFAYMVPYNWFQLPLGLVVLPLTIIGDLELIATEAFSFLSLLVLGVLLTYTTFLARTGLRVSTATAFGLVVLDIVLNLLGGQMIERIQSPG
ncbi:MAG: hypothetical protein SFV19_16315 [Rhodospirillaceae bacterium]|nr:hypothetical protein [Rhodospirillaceae bacterium]